MAVLGEHIEGWDKYGPGFSTFQTANVGTPVPITLPHLVANEWGLLSVGNPSSVYIGPPLSSSGGSGCVIGVGGGTGWQKNLTTNPAKAIGGVRWQMTPGSANANVNGTIIQFRDAGTVQASIAVNPANGSIMVLNAAGTVIATFSALWSIGQTHYLEWNFTMSNSAAWQVWLDGVSIGSGTGANFHGSANNTYNQIILGSFILNFNMAYDDFYPDDGAGSPLLTNPIVETKLSTSDSSVQFTNAAAVVGYWNSLVSVNPGSGIGASGGLFLRKFTCPTGGATLNSVSMFTTATSGAKFKAVLYADSAGSPAALTATGTEVVGTTGNAVFTSPFGAGQTLVAGTVYWIGFITDTFSVTIGAENATPANGWGKVITYASGAPNPAGAAALASTANFSIWGNCTGTAGNWFTEAQQMPPDTWFGLNANTDYSYTTDNTVGHEDLFGVAGLTSTPTTIYCTKVSLYARDSAAGARTVKIQTKSSATDDPGSNSAGFTPSTTYGWFKSSWLLDPNGSIAWTKANLDAALMGYKITA